MPNATFSPIPPSQIGGAIAINVFVILSTLALLPVTIRVIWLTVQRPWLKSLSPTSVFFQTQIGHYVACLIVAMLSNTLAGLFGIAWVFMQGIQDGPLCGAQAFFMAIGTISSGYFTVAIAVHSFSSLVLQKRQSTKVCRLIIAFGWLLSILIAAIPFGVHSDEGAAYGPDGVICGIRSIFPKLQFFFHLLPVLFSSLLGAILYSLTFLVLRGTVKLGSGVKLTLNPTERWANRKTDDESYRRFVSKLSRSMLWYPVAYGALLVPYSMVRMFALSGFSVSFEAIVFAFVCWYLLSVVDVPLLYHTFRLLSTAFDDTSQSTTPTDVESFATEDRDQQLEPSTNTRLADSPLQGVSRSTVWSIDARISEKVMSEPDPTPSEMAPFPTPLVEPKQVVQTVDAFTAPQTPANTPTLTQTPVNTPTKALWPVKRRPSQSTPRDVSFIEEIPPLPLQSGNLTAEDSPPLSVRPLNLSRRPTGVTLPSNPRPPRLPPPLFVTNLSRSSPGIPLIRQQMRTDLSTTAPSELTYLQDPFN